MGTAERYRRSSGGGDRADLLMHCNFRARLCSRIAAGLSRHIALLPLRQLEPPTRRENFPFVFARRRRTPWRYRSHRLLSLRSCSRPQRAWQAAMALVTRMLRCSASPVVLAPMARTSEHYLTVVLLLCFVAWLYLDAKNETQSTFFKECNTHAHACTRTRAHTHTHTCVHARMHTPAHSDAHKHVRAHTCTHAHMQAYTHPHPPPPPHTHTHTRALPSWCNRQHGGRVSQRYRFESRRGEWALFSSYRQLYLSSFSDTHTHTHTHTHTDTAFSILFLCNLCCHLMNAMALYSAKLSLLPESELSRAQEGSYRH